jgi:hypothetical protein
MVAHVIRSSTQESRCSVAVMSNSQPRLVFSKLLASMPMKPTTKSRYSRSRLSFVRRIGNMLPPKSTSGACLPSRRASSRGFS